MKNKKKPSRWEGVRLVRDKEGNIIAKKIYDYKTGKLLRTEKKFYPVIKIENFKEILRDNRKLANSILR